jgi:uncharacterized protein YlbG (UPF0298 family)
MDISDGEWQPVSNELNTFAAEGMEPLPEIDIRTRLISDVLFMGKVVIPSQSLLCNPATYKWLRDARKRELFKWLISNGKLIILTYKETPSFEDLLEYLKERKTVALKWVKEKELQNIARELDFMSSDKHAKLIYVNREDVEKSKTQLSLSFISKIDRICPSLALPKFKEKLISEAENEINNAGVIHGSWWNTLSCRNKLFVPFDKELKEIGTIVFDFSHAITVNRFLIGHPYRRTVLGLGGLTEHLVKQWKVEVEPGVFDVRDVDATIFVRDVIEKIDVGIMKLLDEETKDERIEYLSAIDKLFRQPDEDALLEVKSRMDNYINKLGNYLQTTALKNYIEKIKTISNLKSSLMFWQSFDTIMCSLCTGITGSGIIDYLRSGGGSIGLILTFFGFSLGYLSHEKLKEKIDRTRKSIQKQQIELDRIRPISFAINPKRPENTWNYP